MVVTRRPSRPERESLLGRGLKACYGKGGCGKLLPASAFHRDSKSWDGLVAYCKDCRLRATHKWRHKEPDKAASYARHIRDRRERPLLESLGLKRCIWSGCDTVKPVSEFHKHSGSADGLNPRCKSCNKAGAKKWYEDNPERSLEYRTSRREHTRLYCGSLRATEAGNRVDEFTWPDLLDYWSENAVPFDRCYLCGERGEYNGVAGLHIDHVVPIARGGAHSMDNLRPACSSCNLMKHSSTLDEYRDRVVRTASFLLSDN